MTCVNIFGQTKTVRRIYYMMAVNNEHPLDVELLEYILDELDSSHESSIHSHMGKCLLCRIRSRRISAHNLSDVKPNAGTANLAIPVELLHIFDTATQTPSPQPEEIWLAGHEKRTLVWIRHLLGKVVTVHPVTIDIDLIDETALIIHSCPTIDEPIGIITSIISTVPSNTLTIRLGHLPVMNAIETIRTTTSTGIPNSLPTGQPITGATDERLEFRQLLADEITALDRII